MSLPLFLLAIGLMPQSDPATLPRIPGTPPPTTAAQEQAPPEEDEALAPKQYAFNPIQASKEIRTGDFYMKKGKYKAAAARYLEATKWNNQMGEAFLKLGEADEKQDELKMAREAYQHFLEISPDSKEASHVKKRLQKLPAN